MSPEQLKEEVDYVISRAGDDEGAHAAEDELHLKIINAFCPDWVKAEVKRMTDTDFNRWCA